MRAEKEARKQQRERAHARKLREAAKKRNAARINQTKTFQEQQKNQLVYANSAS